MEKDCFLFNPPPFILYEYSPHLNQWAIKTAIGIIKKNDRMREREMKIGRQSSWIEQPKRSFKAFFLFCYSNEALRSSLSRVFKVES